MSAGRRPASTLLRRLESVVSQYAPTSAGDKVELVRALERLDLGSARAVERFHEALCFLRAYPDTPGVLRVVESALSRFVVRRDLRRSRAALVDSGISGTDTYYEFFWPIARWLAERWPKALELDWDNTEESEALATLLRLLVTPPENEALDEVDFSPRQWLARLAGERTTDATFLVRRLEAMAAADAVTEEMHDGLGLAYRLRAGSDTPARGTARYAPSRVVFRRKPLQRARPVLSTAVHERPRVRKLSARQGRVLLDMARAAMVTRSRDLYIFAHGDARSVLLVDFGDGLEFAVIGFPPEKRLLLHGVWGYLTLQNGVPIGYVLTSVLFGMAGVAYNTFETYRGGEAGRVFGRVLAMTRELFGALKFTIDPYQLGYGNTEGLKSGAWWFYYKLGFRPNDPEVRRVLRRELRAMRRNPGHRSSLATLEKLASADVFLDLTPGQRSGRLDLLPLWNVSLELMDRLTTRFGTEREAGLQVCADEAAAQLGVRWRRDLGHGERIAWLRWAPLVVSLPRLRSWSRDEKRALVQVIRAKGAPSEVEFVRRFDAHPKLGRALLSLAST